MGETVPGGRYFDVRGKVRDSEGKLIEPQPIPVFRIFPSYEILIENGIKWADQIPPLAELKKLDGIGAKTADAIYAVLNKEQEDSK